jgi:site-specific recombinase XerD
MRLHDLRHSFASLFIESGGDLRTLQELLGHTRYQTTEIYAHVSDRHLQTEIMRIQFPLFKIK